MLAAPQQGQLVQSRPALDLLEPYPTKDLLSEISDAELEYFLKERKSFSDQNHQKNPQILKFVFKSPPNPQIISAPLFPADTELCFLHRMLQIKIRNKMSLRQR